MQYFELSKEEEQIISDLEKGKLVSVGGSKMRRIYEKYAQNTLKKTKNINLRLPSKVLAKLKAKAAKEGIPYQTLASSILHRFTNE